MKANLPSPSSASPGDPRLDHTDSKTGDSTGKMSEKEKFDALLDAERNLGKEQDSTWKESRWP